MNLEDGMGLLGRQALARELDNAAQRYDAHARLEKQRAQNGLPSEFVRWLKSGETVD